jgi:tetratricopeptide (TPR) repeat protein
MYHPPDGDHRQPFAVPKDHPMKRLSLALPITAVLALTALTPAAFAAAAPDEKPAAVGTASSDLHAAPLTAAACRALAEARLKSGDGDGAVAVLRRGMELDARDPDLYATLAEAQAAKGSLAEAVRSWRLAVGEGADQAWSSSRMLDGDLHLRFALWLAAGNGDMDEAVRMYQAGREALADQDRALLPEKWRARDLKKNEATRRAFIAAASTALGMRYASLGQPDRAAASLRAALTVSPNDSVATGALKRVAPAVASRSGGEDVATLTKAH